MLVWPAFGSLVLMESWWHEVDLRCLLLYWIECVFISRVCWWWLWVFWWSQIWENAIDGNEEFISIDPLSSTWKSLSDRPHTPSMNWIPAAKSIWLWKRLAALLKRTHKEQGIAIRTNKIKINKQMKLQWRITSGPPKKQEWKKSHKTCVSSAFVEHTDAYFFFQIFSLVISNLMIISMACCLFYLFLLLHFKSQHYLHQSQCIAAWSRIFRYILSFVFFTGTRDKRQRRAVRSKFYGFTRVMKILWSILCVFKCNK